MSQFVYGNVKYSNLTSSFKFKIVPNAYFCPSKYEIELKIAQ